MSAVRIIVLCMAAAMVCMAIRTQHPQIAAAVALGTGIAAMTLSLGDVGEISGVLRKLCSEDHAQIIRMCGIILIAEFASDICTDSGERALANRINVGVRIALLAAMLPDIGDLLQELSELIE